MSSSPESIEILRAKSEILLKKGKIMESLKIMDDLVDQVKVDYGVESIEFKSIVEKNCEMLNLAAMMHMHKGEHDQAFEYLKRADTISGNSMKSKAVTYNNLACYYRRSDKLKTALSFLTMALEMEQRIGYLPSLADTHLNLCAILSKLGRHESALEHALMSLIFIQDELLESELKLSGGGGAQGSSAQGQAISGSETVRSKFSSSSYSTNNKQSSSKQERLAVVVIGFHNLAVELEHLKRYPESLRLYQRAWQFGADNLGANHPLVQNLQKIVKPPQQNHSNSQQHQQQSQQNSEKSNNHPNDIASRYQSNNLNSERSLPTQSSYRSSSPPPQSFSQYMSRKPDNSPQRTLPILPVIQKSSSRLQRNPSGHSLQRRVETEPVETKTYTDTSISNNNNNNNLSGISSIHPLNNPNNSYSSEKTSLRPISTGEFKATNSQERQKSKGSRVKGIQVNNIDASQYQSVPTKVNSGKNLHRTARSSSSSIHMRRLLQLQNLEDLQITSITKDPQQFSIQHNKSNGSKKKKVSKMEFTSEQVVQARLESRVQSSQGARSSESNGQGNSSTSNSNVNPNNINNLSGTSNNANNHSNNSSKRESMKNSAMAKQQIPQGIGLKFNIYNVPKLSSKSLRGGEQRFENSENEHTSEESRKLKRGSQQSDGMELDSFRDRNHEEIRENAQVNKAVSDNMIIGIHDVQSVEHAQLQQEKKEEHHTQIQESQQSQQEQQQQQEQEQQQHNQFSSQQEQLDNLSAQLNILKEAQEHLRQNRK